jgi:nitronate monooxygenase
MVPGDPSLLTATRTQSVEVYRRALQPWADRFGIEVPQADTSDQPEWEAKLDVLIQAKVDAASFIFGCPTEVEIARLRAAGIAVSVTVTNIGDAMEAERRGCAFLVVQGPEAGGHQGTWSVSAPINELPLVRLVETMRDVVSIPFIAAGGITTGQGIRSMLDAGAVAVQMGTAFLRTPECGASQVYKRALTSGEIAETMQTRAFSGRVAGALANELAVEQTPLAPEAYPELNGLTGPIRAASAAANDASALSLYAGTGFASATERPAGEIIAELWAQTQAGSLREQEIPHDKSAFGGRCTKRFLRRRCAWRERRDRCGP